MDFVKFQNLLVFYKSTLPLNIAVSSVPLVVGGIDFFEAIFLTIGFFSSYPFKEVNRKNEYLFFYNNGITKFQLWMYSYIINFFCLVLLVIVIQLILRQF
jgi:hypothetical protein